MTTRTHDPALEGVRGLAVLIVFLSHTSGREMALAPWLDFHGTGHIGVYLFFVLSGFLLARNLLDGQRVGSYVIRRLFRIVPLYFLVVLATYAAQRQGWGDPRYLFIDGGLDGVLRHLVFVQGDGVFWTIPAEMCFYAILPLFILIATRFGPWPLVTVAVAYFCWFALVRFLDAPLPLPRIVAINEHLGQYVDVFLCGVLAAVLQGKKVGQLGILALVAALVASLAFVAENVLGFHRLLYGFRWLSLAYGIAFALAVLATAQGQPLLSRIFSNPLLRFMGVVGFGWYLMHFAVFQVVNENLHVAVPLKFVVAALGCALVAWLAYIAVERPFMSLGRRLTSGGRAVTPQRQHVAGD